VKNINSCVWWLTQCCHSVNVAETTNFVLSISRDGHQIARCCTFLCIMLSSSAIYGGKLKVALVSGRIFGRDTAWMDFGIVIFWIQEGPFAATWKLGSQIVSNIEYCWKWTYICLDSVLINTRRFGIAITKAKHLARSWARYIHPFPS
jgi:hypothetical protein